MSATTSKRVSASLMLFRNTESDVNEAVACYLASPSAGVLTIVDISTTPLDYAIFREPGVHYIHRDQNLGSAQPIILHSRRPTRIATIT